MKKVHFLSILFSCALFVTLFTSFRDNPDNPPNNYTGSGAATCGNCHSGGSFGGSVTILGVPATIAPSTVYSISVVTAKTTGNSKRAGFQLNVKNGANVVTGTLASTSANVKIENAQFAEHSETNTALNFNSSIGPFAKTWTFNWTSPATTTNNNITFYVASVIGDGSGTSGDQVVTSSALGTFAAAPPPLTVTQIAKTDVTCFGGSNGTAAVNATGGSGCTATYLWSNGQNTQIATGLSVGTYTVTATCGASTGTTSVNITQPATALAANVTGSTLNCVGGTDGTASASASGGGSSYNYLWSNNQTGANLSNLSAGIYNVTITDNNGCTLIKSATVSNPANPISASISSTTAANCTTGGTATVSASGGAAGYSLLWSDNQTGSTATGLSPNTYTVTATDANGCKSITSATVASNMSAPSSTITGNATLTCAQPSATLTAPAGNYTYNWAGGETNSSISTSTSGTYSVTVTNLANGCTSVGTKNISEDKSTAPASITGNTILTCSQPSTTLSAGGNNNYQWTGPNITSSPTAATVNVNGVGAYNVTVTNATNGCTSTATTTVVSNLNAPIVPNINPANPSISCSNTFVTLSSSASNAFTQQWFLNGGNVGSGTQINATQAGSYSLVITDPTNGCTSQSTTAVTSTNITLSVNATGGKITCANPSVALNVTASGAVSYKWVAANFNSTLQNPSVTNAGTYSVIATDGNGCTGSAQAIVSSDTQKPNVLASANGSLSCANPSVLLTASSATSGLTYAWASSAGFSASGNPVSTQQAGNVTVTATNPINGCSNSATVNVTASNDKPILSTTGGTITCKDSVININVAVTGNTTGLTYKWAGPSNFTNTSASSPVKNAGDYSVTVTAGNGCSSIATAKVTADNQAISAQIESNKAFICSNDTISLTAKSAATIQSYLWSDASAKNTTTITKSGTYNVTVTGANGCKGNATLTVADGKKPTIVLKADSLTCSISKLIIGANVTWATALLPNWTGSNNFVSNVLQPEISAAGTYKLSLNPSDGCPAFAEITIKENKTPPSVKIAGETVNCDSMAIELVATSTATNFAWKGFGVNGETTAKVAAEKSGKYIVASTGSNGCIGKDSIEVKLFPSITTSADMTTCSTGNSSLIHLTVAGGKAPFVLTDSSGIVLTSNKVKLKAGLLPITVVDANGCKKQISNVKITLGLLSIDKNLTVVKDATGSQFNGSITLVATGNSGTTKYAWSNAASSQNIFALNAGVYCVTVTDGLGCSVNECFTVKSVISTEDNVLAQAIHVYPNPVTEMLLLKAIQNIDIQGITLLNDKGQTLQRFDNFVPQIDMSFLPQGIYFLKIENEKGEWAMKRVLKM